MGLWRIKVNNIAIISGSQRQHSNSIGLSQYLKTHYFSSTEVSECTIIDLSQYHELLHHYDTQTAHNETLLTQKNELLNVLYQCDAVVIVAPEWGGMLPPALVNLLLLCANGSANGLPLGHKPALAIGVSASSGGANAVNLLKSVGAKNTHMSWLALHAIVQNVDRFLDTPFDLNADHRTAEIQSRLNIACQSLLIYSNQLKPVRKKLVTLSLQHPFGQ